MNYWLLKSEPGTFGIDHLLRARKQTTGWDGVRNFQARNFIRDGMQKGDRAFFYHSGCEVPGVAGIVKISRAAYPDTSAFDPTDDHYDPDSDRKNPRWFKIDVTLEKKLNRIISLTELRQHANGPLKDLIILRRGNRLSITPVSKSEWDFILSLE
jgi:predicted RNA-binding protein with PUA-like domain